MSNHLKSTGRYIKQILVRKEGYNLVAFLVLLSEAVLNTAIINYVRCQWIFNILNLSSMIVGDVLTLPNCWLPLVFTDTEIDWTAYMQQIRGYSLGERNYLKIKGDTGPLV